MRESWGGLGGEGLPTSSAVSGVPHVSTSGAAFEAVGVADPGAEVVFEVFGYFDPFFGADFEPLQDRWFFSGDVAAFLGVNDTPA